MELLYYLLVLPQDDLMKIYYLILELNKKCTAIQKNQQKNYMLITTLKLMLC